MYRTTPSGSSPAPLSVLDLTVVGEGTERAVALRQTIALARAAERWGYRRFWVAEHHSFPASGSPPRPCCSPTSAARPAPSGSVRAV